MTSYVLVFMSYGLENQLRLRRFPSKREPAYRKATRSNLDKILKELSWRPRYSLIAELICNQ